MINIIKNIFYNKKYLTKKKDIDSLSKYTDYIPMYDIYSDTIYPIASENINYRLLKCHYRFITEEIKQWIQNKLNKLDNDMRQKYIDNLNIINCYNLDILEKTSYETLYRYSPDLGLSISICKRNSFNPFSPHLTPYYSKMELIKLGMNNHIIKKLDPSTLIDSLHYSICKKVSKNDISAATILQHIKTIIDNNCIGWIQYYSMTGSYIFNKILRESLPINQSLYNGLNKIIDTINKTSLPNNYYVYRFVWDDHYISKLKIGSKFIDRGFVSTTRDPFYTPGIKKDFGLILIRIKIPKNIGSSLLIENLSMFPKEEEFLIKPNSTFKLIAKDKTTYYHIDETFERLIKKKYEFELIESKKFKLKVEDYIPTINIEEKIEGVQRIDIFDQFKKKCDIYGQYIAHDHVFITEFFDSTSSYQHLYWNKTKDGMIHTSYNEGYPQISIECGEKMVVNYLKTKTFYDTIYYQIIPTDELNKIVSNYCRLFGYREAMIFFEYNNFEEFKANYTDNIEFLSINLYCKTLYDYLNKKLVNTNLRYYKFEYGFWQIDKIMKMSVPEEVINRLPTSIGKKITWGKLFIEIVEKYFYLYNRMEEWFNQYHDNLFKKCYYTFNPNPYLKSIGYNVVDIPEFKHITRDRGELFRIVYEDTVRRI
jgi:hypothetical protein